MYNWDDFRHDASKIIEFSRAQGWEASDLWKREKYGKILEALGRERSSKLHALSIYIAGDDASDLKLTTCLACEACMCAKHTRLVC